MGRKTSSVIIPNPRRTSDVVIYKYILRLIVSFICEKDIFSDYSYFMEKWQCIDWFNIYICVIEKWGFFIIMTLWFCAEGDYMFNEANGFNKWSQILWMKC